MSDEYCPSCGEFVARADWSHVTGFCLECSPDSSVNGTYFGVEQYLASHADELETYMMQGSSFYAALDKLAASSRPSCMVCGAAMPYARRTAVFCRRTSECRRYSRRYTYLYSERKPKLTKSEALALIIGELT